MGRLAEAEAAYSAAAARAPNDWHILVSWGVLGVKRGDGQHALDHLEKAHGMMTGAPPAVWFWAKTLATLLQGGEGPAMKVAEEAVQAHPKRAPLRNNLAALYERVGKAADAQAALKAALEEDPSIPQVSKHLGDLLYNTGSAEEAQTAYLRALKLS